VLKMIPRRRGGEESNSLRRKEGEPLMKCGAWPASFQLAYYGNFYTPPGHRAVGFAGC
jgi:hypothetical protein